MAKLTFSEKCVFDEAERVFKHNNVNIVSIKELGLTIGIKYTCPKRKAHAQVYVTQCGLTDKFKFKRGVNVLYDRYVDDTCIIIPVLGRSMDDMFNAIIDVYHKDVTLGYVEYRIL
jgi:hypothetical protein